MIEEKILKTIQEYDMIRPGEKVLVGLSGGADSTALLYALNSLKNKLGITLYIGHLNHKIRGRESDIDADHVKALSKKLKLPFIMEEFDVPGYARTNKMNLEEAARCIRYGFFERAAAKAGVGHIALGHNADDNIETFLMNLLRGSGLKGLEGIRPVRGNIIRPLISVFRSEIDKYLQSRHIAVRVDSTNFDTKYKRNKIRHELLPALTDYNKNIKEVLLRTINAVSIDQSFIESMSRKAYGSVLTRKKSNEVILDIKKLSRIPRSIKAGVIRLSIQEVKNGLADITFGHIEDILRISDKIKAEIDLPGIYVLLDKGKLKFSTLKPSRGMVRPFLHKLDVPGHIKADEAGYIIDAEILKVVPKSKLYSKDRYKAYMDYDKIEKPLLVRGRKDGDVFSPLGMAGKKKLQDIFVDEKFDHDIRDKIPIVEDGKHILWVIGYRISDRVKVTQKTKRILKLSAKAI